MKHRLITIILMFFVFGMIFAEADEQKSENQEVKSIETDWNSQEKFSA